MDWFLLFFNMDLVQWLCDWTNENAEIMRADRPSYAKDWTDVDPPTMLRFFALLMYMGIVHVPNVEKYWCTDSLYHGLWARAFMSRDRFKQILCFLKTASPGRVVNPNDKLDKIRLLFDLIRRRSIRYFTPNQNVAIDERMVRNKGRYAFRQYIKDKPTKWGMKIWVLADSETGYSCDFSVYLGKDTKSSIFGLAYDVVMNLVKSLGRQGYNIFFDNFYTGVQLLRDLLAKGFGACGTVRTNRKGFPECLKDSKKWEKRSHRGDMRWHRDRDILTVQWRDNKTVTVMSTIHSGSKFSEASRRCKENGQFKQYTVKQPYVIKDYNKYMSGVDRSDQMIGRYNMLRKTNKWWKTLFFHLIDIARVNSFILFQNFREQNQDIPELKRKKRYSQLEFTEELIRGLAQLSLHDEIPSFNVRRITCCHSLTPVFTDVKRNCKLCYAKEKKERKSRVKCASCDTYLCFNGQKNCLLEYHSSN